MECSNRGRSDTSLSLKQGTSVPDSDERDGILMHPIGNKIYSIQILKRLSYGTEGILEPFLMSLRMATSRLSLSRLNR